MSQLQDFGFDRVVSSDMWKFTHIVAEKSDRVIKKDAKIRILMKLNFTYGATREGEIFIESNLTFFCEIAPMGLDISSIPEEHKGEFIKKDI